ncbi:diguanylate cyclase [Salipaludibacillus agaradhaerens]|jgi:diguanylate cyclase (GGDEF)-like protein|uniref:diguanylate cyclase n=1 Tax=Salipaludibacillus agaradhaerens TaxID=76935 RepID=UPI0009963787|nr:diguanylate cyclase [Salipaludibacillus agaradhaerens]MCR6105466.1 diguanylate cyclase [Salipaludibacillus agaradhaerens]MCR6109551.1 diguanylate cyclase [Bacillus sp. A301a_S52]MCR6117504.1 diguanylate cyclase [Salipaludibacillus agaradhaerens]UJW56693.1 diguanylate cyclase [Bacillus sp. A116_S68]
MDINIEQKLNKLLEGIDEKYRDKHYTLAFVDIDKCKPEKGALEEITRTFLEVVKDTLPCDAYYVGRDEFILILEGCKSDKALNLLMDLKHAWKNSEKNTFHLTFSAGIASNSEHGDHASQVLTGAEEGLYRAKQEGRNMIMQPEKDQKIMKSNYYYPYQLKRLKMYAEKTNNKEADILRLALNEFFRRHDEL